MLDRRPDRFLVGSLPEVRVSLGIAHRQALDRMLPDCMALPDQHSPLQILFACRHVTVVTNTEETNEDNT